MSKLIQNLQTDISTHFFIVDSWMGAGKSTSSIMLINSDPTNKYIVVTEYLEEADRYMRSCPAAKLIAPESKYSKGADFEKLVRQGSNIVTTHALLQNVHLSEPSLELMKQYQYTIIIDEALNVVNPLDTVPEDIDNMIDQQYIEVDSDNNVQWINKTYSGDHSVWKKVIKSGRVKYIPGNQDQENKPALIWVMDPSILRAASKVYVLTFNFDGSYMKPYLDLNGFNYTRCYVNNSTFVRGEEDRTIIKERVRSLLDIYTREEEKYNIDHNEIGNGLYDLSKNWYRSKKNALKALTTGKNYLRSHQGRSSNSLFTVFEDIYNKYGMDGYAKSFIPCNTRGTNKYADRYVLAYLINIFPHPCVNNYFHSQNNQISVNMSQVALNQLMQWIWRSAIRNNQAVKLFLPSSRMRNILNSYLDV